ncbi:MAG: hypothetical protein M0Z27_01965 [Thermaerobacter sp.]|nr:hypothetical protein [Thermaerobacter sp.]
MRPWLGSIGVALACALLAAAPAAFATTTATGTATTTATVSNSASLTVAYSPSSTTAIAFGTVGPGKTVGSTDALTTTVSASGYTDYTVVAYDTDYIGSSSSSDTIPGTALYTRYYNLNNCATGPNGTPTGYVSISNSSSSPTSLVGTTAISSCDDPGWQFELQVPSTAANDTYSNTVTYVATFS